MRYMLDTNICIYAIKHKPEKVFQNIDEELVDPAHKYTAPEIKRGCEGLS